MRLGRRTYPRFFAVFAFTQAIAVVTTAALAQGKPKLTNVDLCDGKDPSTIAQIVGCTALIKSSANDPKVLASAYNNRGNAFAKERRYDLAIRDYDDAIRLNPGGAKALNNRGVAYQKKGDYDRAIEDLDAAIRTDPTYASAYANRAATYEQKGDFAHSLNDLDEAIRLSPPSAKLRNERCWAYAIVGNLEPALADCNESIRTLSRLPYSTRAVWFT